MVLFFYHMAYNKAYYYRNSHCRDGVMRSLFGQVYEKRQILVEICHDFSPERYECDGESGEYTAPCADFIQLFVVQRKQIRSQEGTGQYAPGIGHHIEYGGFCIGDNERAGDK